MTIEGGTFKTNNPEASGDNTIVINRGTLVIKGGKFERTGKGDLITNSYNNSSTTITGGEFNSECKDVELLWNGSPNCLNATGGIYSDDSVKKYIDDDAVLVKSGDKYAVNESGYELAKDGKPIEIVKAPANTRIDNVPGGITVKNNSGNTIIINGKEIADGESYFEPLPTIPTVTYDAPVFKYWVVEGKDQTWTKSGSESLNYVLNADANNLVKVLIDGEEVEFEIDENGEVVISAEVLEKLDAGEYEIEFIFADGSCKTKLFVK